MSRFMIFIFTALIVGAVSGSSDLDGTLPPVLPVNVMLWTAADVELWMNYTIGYPEYAEGIRAHLVDGPTLVSLTTHELTTGLGIRHVVHARKVVTHVEMLRGGNCICSGASGVHDFWTFADRYKDVVWVGGSLAAFTPRAALLYSLVSSNELYAGLYAGQPLSDQGTLGVYSGDSEEGAAQQDGAMGEGTASEVVPGYRAMPLWRLTLTLLGIIVAPHFVVAFYMLYHFTSNFILFTLLIFYCIVSQFNDWFRAYAVYNHTLEERAKNEFTTGTLFVLLATFTQLHSLFPVAAFLLSYVLPYVMQTLVMYVFLVHACLLTAGNGYLIACYLREKFTAAAAAEEGQHPKSE